MPKSYIHITIQDYEVGNYDSTQWEYYGVSEYDSWDVCAMYIEYLVGEAGLIKEEILKHVTSWQSQANLGFTVEAMNTYRKQNNCSIKEAHEAVKAFQNQK